MIILSGGLWRTSSSSLRGVINWTANRQCIIHVVNLVRRAKTVFLGGFEKILAYTRLYFYILLSTEIGVEKYYLYSIKNKIYLFKNVSQQKSERIKSFKYFFYFFYFGLYKTTLTVYF